MKRRHTVFAMICALALQLQGTAVARMVSIAGEDINMRSGPGTTQPILWKLGSGFPLEVMAQKGAWLHVRDFEGSTGWVHQKTTQKAAYVIVRANKDNGQQINVRQKPNTDAKVVAQANYGVVFRVLGTQGAWVNVEHTREGISGWILGSLLWGDE